MSGHIELDGRPDKEDDFEDAALEQAPCTPKIGIWHPRGCYDVTQGSKIL